MWCIIANWIKKMPGGKLTEIEELNLTSTRPLYFRDRDRLTFDIDKALFFETEEEARQWIDKEGITCVKAFQLVNPVEIVKMLRTQLAYLEEGIVDVVDRLEALNGKKAQVTQTITDDDGNVIESKTFFSKSLLDAEHYSQVLTNAGY